MSFRNWIQRIQKDADEAAERAAEKGASLLDRIKPDWFKAIDQDKLDIGSFKYCILGQLFGSWSAGKKALQTKNSGVYGFAPPTFFSCFSHRLDDVWKEQIQQRLAA